MYLEEGENACLSQPGCEAECDGVETEGEGLTGLVLLTPGHTQPGQEAAGGAQNHRQPPLQAGTIRAEAEDKEGEHDEAKSGQQAGAPCRHHQVVRVGGCNSH